MENAKKIKVLIVTGIYFPESKINGAILQVRKTINALKNKIYFEVLTDTKVKELANHSECDGIKVNRIHINSLWLINFGPEFLVRLYPYFISIRVIMDNINIFIFNII